MTTVHSEFQKSTREGFCCHDTFNYNREYTKKILDILGNLDCIVKNEDFKNICLNHVINSPNRVFVLERI